MKRIALSIGAVVAMLGATACLVLAARPPAADGLRSPAPIAEVGNVDQKTTRDATFELINDGAEPVLIHQIQQSCDCTKADLDKSRLAPGERATIRATWDTGLRRGPSETHIRVLHRKESGKSLELLNLTFRGRVLPDYAVQPERLTIDAGATGPARLSIAPGRKGDVRIGRAYATHAALTAEVAPDGRTVWVRLDASKWPAGVQESTIVVETNSEVEPSYRVPVLVKAAPVGLTVAAGSP